MNLIGLFVYACLAISYLFSRSFRECMTFLAVLEIGLLIIAFVKEKKA